MSKRARPWLPRLGPADLGLPPVTLGRGDFGDRAARRKELVERRGAPLVIQAVATEDRPFTIQVDSREQTPLDFFGWPVVVEGMDSGDYSIAGCADRVAIERKGSLGDLFACVGRERERFERCLDRLSKLDYAALLIEASFDEVLAGFDRSEIAGATAIGSILAWSVAGRLPVFFVPGRRNAAACVSKLLSKWWKRAIGEPGNLPGWRKL